MVKGKGKAPHFTLLFTLPRQSSSPFPLPFSAGITFTLPFSRGRYLYVPFSCQIAFTFTINQTALPLP
jgi:hypothetical protein